MINLPDEHTLVVAIVITKLDGNKFERYLEVLYYTDGKWFKRNNFPLDNNTKVISWKYQDEIDNIINNQKYSSPKYAIEKKFNFAAAHALEHLGQDHLCGSIHGHNYVLTIRIESDQLDDTGFVIDFSVLSRNLKDDIEGIDHSFMITTNTSFKDEIKNISVCRKIFTFPEWCENTSSEYICRYFHYRVKELLEIRKSNYNKIIIKLSETDNNLAEYSE